MLFFSSQSGWKYAVAKITVFKQFQKKAGLHMCKHIFVGSAPMHQATFEFFKSLNISISELYGLTECSGLHSIKFKSATQSKPKSCGKQLNGVETNIIECGVDEHNRGEVKLHDHVKDFICKFIGTGFDSW